MHYTGYMYMSISLRDQISALFYSNALHFIYLFARTARNYFSFESIYLQISRPEDHCPQERPKEIALLVANRDYNGIYGKQIVHLLSRKQAIITKSLICWIVLCIVA